MKNGHTGGGSFRLLADIHDYVVYIVQLDHWRPHEHIIEEDWPTEKKQRVGEHIDLLHSIPAGPVSET